MCDRCCVPLRVPMCTLTEVLWHIRYRDELEDMRLPQRAVLAISEDMGCSVRWLKQITMGLFHYYRYRAFNRYILCKHLSLLALGWAVLSRVPIPGDCFGRARARMLLLLPLAFLCIPFVFNMSKNDSERWGFEPRCLRRESFADTSVPPFSVRSRT